MASANDSTQVKFVSYNLHGFYQGFTVVNDLIADDEPDVLLLQEHWLTPANLSYFDQHFSNYFSFGVSAMRRSVEQDMLRGRPFGGVITLINNSLRNVTKTIHCDDRYTIVKIADCLFINLYLPCVGTSDRLLICDDILQHVMSWCERYDGCQYVVAGDFNVNLDDATDGVAVAVNSFARNFSLVRSDNLFPQAKRSTYVNLALNHESQIDYILVSCTMKLNNFEVLDPDVNFSDHLPLSATITYSTINQGLTSQESSTPTQKYLRWDHANIDAYYYYTGAHLHPLLNALNEMSLCCDTCVLRNNINSIYDSIVAILQTGAKHCVPVCSKNFFKFWWDEELNILKQASVEANKLWKSAGRPRCGPIFNKRQSTRLKYRKCVRDRKSQCLNCYTNDLHEALLKKNGTSFWKCWRSKFEMGNGKCTEVEHCVDTQAIADKFADYFERCYTYNNAVRMKKLQDEYLVTREDYLGCHLPNDTCTIDAELVDSIIRKLERGKAADVDGISAEHIFFCNPIISVVLAKLFELIMLCGYVPTGFKFNYIVPIPKVKDCRTKSMACDDFRGIAISPIISKVFEHCFLDRFKEYLTSADNQFGFKKGVSCSFAVYSVRRIVDKFVAGGCTVNLCSIDLSKAFDKVNHYGLLLKLMKRQLPVKLLSVLESLLIECYSCVKWNNVTTANFTINFGVRQGSVLSPFLFAIYLDDLCKLCTEERCRFIVVYADDIMLISPSIVELERLLHACENELNWLDMAINFKKSCCVRIGPRYDANCVPIVSLTGHFISWSDEVRYLGIYVISSRIFKCSLTYAKRSFYKAANAIFGKVGRLASEEVTLHLIRSKCIPVLLYGLEVCPLNVSDIKSLDFVINRFFMKLFYTNAIDVVKLCQDQFGFDLPSVLIEKRRVKFMSRLEKFQLDHFMPYL